MSKEACDTLKTRLAFHHLSQNKKLKTYFSYLQNKISREELWKIIPEGIIDSVINNEISGKTIERPNAQIRRRIRTGGAARSTNERFVGYAGASANVAAEALGCYLHWAIIGTAEQRPHRWLRCIETARAAADHTGAIINPNRNAAKVEVPCRVDHSSVHRR